jgi:hypothetical protein
MSHSILPIFLAGSSEDPAATLMAVMGSRNSVPEGVRAAFAVNGIENERSKRRRLQLKISKELHELSHRGVLKIETDAEKITFAEQAPTLKALLDSFKHPPGGSGGGGGSTGGAGAGSSTGSGAARRQSANP